MTRVISLLFVIVLLAIAIGGSWDLSAAEAATCSSHGITVTRQALEGQVAGRFYFMGATNDIVLVGTSTGVLYKSEDGGAHWTKITTMPSQPSNLRIATVIISKDKKQVLVSSQATNCSACLFTTQLTADGKKLSDEWKKVDMKTRITDFAAHPTEDGLLAALVDDPACSSTTTRNQCQRELIISSDFGQNWAAIWTYVDEFSWAGAGTNGLPINQLFVVDWEDKKGDYRDKIRGGVTKRVLKTNDYFSTKAVEVQDNVNDFLAIGDDLFIVKSARQGGLELHTSIDMGRIWTKSIFPHETIERSYTILDTTEGSVFINIQHLTSDWGNVYVSDSYGGRFSLTLPRNPRFLLTQQCDFTRVLGIDGIYLANQFDESIDDKGRDTMSKMSFSKGSTWERIPAPASQLSKCADPKACYLNLHGTTTDNRNRFISRRYSPGVVLGTGNVGPYLTRQTTSKNTFLSNDAGKTWTFFANGTYEYEISNYGGLIMMASNTQATRSIHWTENEGQEWTECELDGLLSSTEQGQSIEITDIIAEPKGGAPEFIVYGRPRNSGWDTPGAPNSDFELWIPTTQDNGCEMGRKTSYIRKKPWIDCLIPESYDPTKSSKLISNCQCTSADFECDDCFKRDENNKCVLACDEDPRRPPAVCKGTYYETLGYRKIPGNSCNITLGGVNLLPIVKGCAPALPYAEPTTEVKTPETSDKSSLLWAIAIPVVAVIIAIMGILYAVSGKSQAVRSCCCLPESWLPEFNPPVATYNKLPTSLEPSRRHSLNTLDIEPLQLEPDASIIDISSDDKNDPSGTGVGDEEELEIK